MKDYSDLYSPKGKLMWDAWFIEKDKEHHMFYLQSLPPTDPGEHHAYRVSIGQAKSKNLELWEELPIAREHGEFGSFDDWKLNSGSVAEKNGTYYLYYTGRTETPGQENIQKIGVATSDDLIQWKKSQNNPILECDSRFYMIDNDRDDLGKIGAWRDPFVFKDPHSNKRYMTITARSKNERPEYFGCVGIAESNDMLHWKVLPPIFDPGIYNEIEVTRVIFHNNLFYLFFSTHASNYKPEYAEIYGRHSGLHCYYSNNLFEGYKPVNGNGVVLDSGHDLYDVRVLHKERNEFTGVGWINRGENGEFVGKLSRPISLMVEGDHVYEI
jgi:beta-fructofuranosidase